MVEIAAHLVGHVITLAPVRQWVFSQPKRLRCHLDAVVFIHRLAALIPLPRRHRYYDQRKSLWDDMLARIDEALPLLCPDCGGTLWIIAVVQDPAEVKMILMHLRESSEASRLAPVRSPPLGGGGCDQGERH